MRKQILTGRKSWESCKISPDAINSFDIFCATFTFFKVSSTRVKCNLIMHGWYLYVCLRYCMCVWLGDGILGSRYTDWTNISGEKN